MSGLGTSPVDIQLFNCNNVTTGSNGQTTFTGTNPGGSGNYAKPGSTGGSITVVNGTPTGNGNGVTPNNGSVTFSVTDNTAGDCLVPVVFQQGTGANADSLPLNADNTPSVPFGTGGQASFVQYATAPSTMTNVPVKSENSTTFTDTSNTTYKYASTDVYQLQTSTGPKADTYADFQQRLSQGDTVSGYYNSPNQSTFILTDQAPEPGTVTATHSAANTGGVDLTIAPSSSTDVTSYNIYRATATPTSGAVNAPLACPANPGTQGQSPQVAPSTSNAWTKIGSVASTATQTGGNYTYTDATPAPATGTAPQYCYLVSAVGPNAAGTSQEGTGVGPAQNANGGVAPSQASAASSAPKFANASTGTVGNGSTNSVTAYYNQAITASTVDAGDFTVVYAVNGVNHSDAVLTATGNNNGTNGSGEAVLTVADLIPAGATVTITSKQGTDNNTVGNTATPEQFQAVGESVQTTAADTTPATFNAAATGNTATFTANEPLAAGSISQSDFTTTVASTNPITSVTYNSTTHAITVTFTNAPGAGKTVTLTAGSVTDAQGNPSPTSPVTATF